MAFCQRFCKRVCQPPVQLRGVWVYSHGCKQGCFQPWRPCELEPGRWPSRRAGLGDHKAVGRYSNTKVAKYTRGESARTGGKIFFADEGPLPDGRRTAGQVGAERNPGSGGLDQPAVWGEGQLLFGSMLGDGRGGVDGTGGQQQLRDLGGLSGTTEEEALWAIERDLGQCPGAPWRGSAGISQDARTGAAVGEPTFSRGQALPGYSRTSTGMRRSGAGRGRRPPAICAWEAGPRCRRGSAASSPVWPAGAARSNGAAGRCCNRGPKRSCQIPSPIPGVRQMHIPPWPWFR